MATVAMAATRTSIEEEKFYTFSIGNARTECNSEFSSNKHSQAGRMQHLEALELKGWLGFVLKEVDRKH